MNLQGFEARHIAVLDMLFTERHVGRAADRLHLSQPAVSNSLAWLRRHFNDPLLIRSGGALRLTPFAERLREPVRKLLLDFRAVATVRPSFETRTATQHFRLTISQSAAASLMAPLLRAVAGEAPRVTIECKPIDGDRYEFERGEIDILVLPWEVLYTGHPRERLFSDEWMCVISADHLGSRQTISADEYRAARHVLADVQQAISWQLEALGVRREVAAIVPHSQVVDMLPGTPWLATMPKAVLSARPQRNVSSLPLPFEIGPQVIGMQWHRDTEGDPAAEWLRDHVRRAAREAGLSLPSSCDHPSPEDYDADQRR
jgi:DNA-binding transcriptional LysR family regulator